MGQTLTHFSRLYQRHKFNDEFLDFKKKTLEMTIQPHWPAYDLWVTTVHNIPRPILPKDATLCFIDGKELKLPNSTLLKWRQINSKTLKFQNQKLPVSCGK